MKTFLRVVLALFILAALGAAGWVGRVLWNENRRLLAEKAAVDVERLRFATGKDAAESELKVVSSDNASLQRDLLTMRAAREKAEAEAKRLLDENARLKSQLSEERWRSRVVLEKTPKSVQAKPTAVSVPQHRSEFPSEDMGSLKDLLELTDKAPRRTK